MTTFFQNYQYELIASLVVFISFIISRYLMLFTITKVGKKNGLNNARIRTIKRYMSALLLAISIVLVSFIFGTKFHEITVIFSSAFAIIGIGLFAVWSILSNITSGIILFFSFPHKVGDKIEIHDVDFPINGIIEDIRTFHLYLRLENGDLVTYPNNLMLQKAVTLIQKDAIEKIDRT